MKDYYFYKIVCNDLTVKHTYVGSTENFTIRKSAHKSKSNNPKYSHLKIYTKMASTGGWSNWEMVLIESRRFGTRLEAKQLERFHYEQLNREFAMNMIFPCRDKAEYYLDNKEKMNQYYLDNKEKRNQYCLDNKESISAQRKIYYLDNKEKSHRHVKHNCICGGLYTTNNLQQHMKTNKHQKYIDQIKK